MVGEEKIIYVYDDFTADAPILLGKLYVGVIKQGEAYSFEYDVNPVPYVDELSLLVNEGDNSISVDLAISTAPRFGIAEEEAERIAKEMLSVIRDNWERLAKEYGLSRGQIEYIRVCGFAHKTW